ncbi:MAG: DNA-3-methyladenine glycosylase 2 family protein [Chitinophagales bacterium]|nr:DNA-3-methyladenine glycosylase 2 family protein [Chitinophagales bacterium]MCB9021585.1 DNA-3-methyladenine glycosylase 2 family protein [Chitinophagales bacterium]MCB9031162.1 DNA-3-methyladenine glycosylase 2 family protein [Chitinophagales bacterium]HAE34532.1 DNA-3-methyladenine glycosylase 2 family protein [Bacteroidota bacterium]
MEYLHHLQKDKQLRPALKTGGPFALKSKGDPYLYLMYSIMSQQLSTKVAEVLKNRFHTLAGHNRPTAEEVLAMPVESLRGIGFSYAKAGYVHAVATFSLEEDLSRRRLNRMDDEEVIAHVTRIKGVGKWTAEMLLMFCLGRPDVMPVDDLGIQQAMTRLYDLDPADSKQLKKDMLFIAERWRPYRTYACMHLWNWKDQ